MEGKVTLNTTTGAKIVVWRNGDVLCARLADATEPPEECLAVDLFEVVAELAGLSLDDGAQAAEALDLAERAQRRLAFAESDSALPDDSEADDSSAHASG